MPGLTGEAVSAASLAPETEADEQPKITCWHVVVEAVDGVWPRVEPLLRKAVNWSETTAKMECVEDIYQLVKSGDYALWLVLEGGQVLAAMVVGMTKHSRCFVLDIHYGAGDDMARWIGPFYEEIVERARAAGCRFIRINGRKGWSKPLKALGFSEAYVAHMREI